MNKPNIEIKDDWVREWFDQLKLRVLERLPRRKSDIERIHAAISDLDYGTKAFNLLREFEWKLKTKFRTDCVPNNDREVEITVLNGNVSHRMKARFFEGVWVDSYSKGGKEPDVLENFGITVNGWREISDKDSDEAG